MRNGELKFALTGYLERAMASAQYDKLGDNSFAGRVTKCKGVIAFGRSLTECHDELRSTMEDWILVGLRMGHRLPVIGGIDLNKRVKRVSMASV
jgi:predicted RNase H-like HicB family nuclease